MKKSALGDDWPLLAPRPRPGHRYHAASIAMPFLGLAVVARGVFLIDLPCSLPEVIEALLYYADESDEAAWHESIVYIP